MASNGCYSQARYIKEWRPSESVSKFPQKISFGLFGHLATLGQVSKPDMGAESDPREAAQ